MNTAPFPCENCSGTGEMTLSRGHQGFICEACNGTGGRLCDICRLGIATTIVEGNNYACSACAREPHDTEIPPAPDTVRSLELPANDTGEPEVVDEETDLRMAQLMASAELIEDARGAGVPPHEAFRILRKAAR